jgi:tryptophan synthase alpha chain
MRLGDVTGGLQERGEKALVAFLTAGYPDERTFVEVAVGAAEAGCDVIEVGVPFSDPIADGPVIQQSSQAALAGGMTLLRALDLTREIATRTETPLVIMSYLNPILNAGLEQFAEAAVESGVSGVILPDVSLEESADIRGIVAAAGLAYVDLVAPTSGTDRIRAIVAAAGDGGFLYLVSVTGVTGSGQDPSADLESFVARVRGETSLPLYVGFGISTPEQARRVAGAADGVIIGSQLIRLLGEPPAEGDEAVRRVGEFLTEVKRAVTGEHDAGAA